MRAAGPALALALAAACAPALVAPTVVRDPRFSYPPTDARSVAVYRDPPAADYEVIGEVEVRVAGTTPVAEVEEAVREAAARIGAHGVVLVVRDVVTEQRVQRPSAGAQQPVGISGAPGGGGVVTLPAQTGRGEEVTIRVHEKEITGLVIRLKKSPRG